MSVVDQDIRVDTRLRVETISVGSIRLLVIETPFHVRSHLDWTAADVAAAHPLGKPVQGEE